MLPYKPLYEDEREALRLMVKGHTIDGIAEILNSQFGLTHRQARRRIETAIWKLGAGKATEAVAKAIALKIVPLEEVARYYEIPTYQSSEKVTQREYDLLNRLFGPGNNGRIITIPADDHLYNPLPPEMQFYRNEMDAAMACLERFPPVSSGVVEGDESIAVFGGWFSNSKARKVLTPPDTFLEPPVFILTSPYNRWQVYLHWKAQMAVDAPVRQIKQNGIRWNSKENQFYHRDSCEAYKATYLLNETVSHLPSMVQINDYLRITALPGDSRRAQQRVLIFDGLHSAGTWAAAQIFREPSMRELEKMEKRLGKDQPFYQALFEVTVSPNKRGEPTPREISLIDAFPLEIQYA